MTLIEMLIAMVVFTVVIGGAFGFFRAQGKGFALGSDRMNMLQNLRYAANVLEKELRAAGSNVPDNQPYIVYAGSDVFAFNGDVVSNVASDPFAIYHDADAPPGAVSALTQGDQITIPQTSFVYPTIDYRDPGGLNSSAELIVFYFAPDASTTRSDDYVLYRQVNAQAPEVVARDLLQTAGLPFFQYYRLFTPRSAPAYVDTIPAAQLPVIHSVAEHLSTLDAGAPAVIDSIRGVRVNFTSTNSAEGAAERRRTITRVVRLPNAGLATRRVCGDEPILGTGLTAAVRVVTGGGRVVDLTWAAATDETGGEKDVVRYVIWRRAAPTPDWGDPLLSIPAGSPTYTFTDGTVRSGFTYSYQLTAQDCTPKLSTPVQSNPVVVP